ncbi:MAG: helix-turn-helix transcriptional regulator [Ruminococcaceae bacterium]|nr:helix-turn-helix transcriptional regulator [Oscillospiraceae bacterium]
MVKFVDLGNYLHDRRCMLEYTQEDVAAIINISERTLRNIEYGLTSPDLKTIMKLWDLYDLSADELFLFYSRDDVMNEMETIYQNIKKRKIPAGKK